MTGKPDDHLDRLRSTGNSPTIGASSALANSISSLSQKNTTHSTQPPEA